jgi:hypothetical protein
MDVGDHAAAVEEDLPPLFDGDIDDLLQRGMWEEKTAMITRPGPPG